VEVVFTTIKHIIHSDWAATVPTTPCVCYTQQKAQAQAQSLKVSDVYLKNYCVCCA